MDKIWQQNSIQNIKNKILDSKDMREIKRYSLLAIALLRSEYEDYITGNKCQVSNHEPVDDSISSKGQAGYRIEPVDNSIRSNCQGGV